MSEITAREMSPRELSETLAVRNTIFPAITEDDWHGYREQTASIALRDGAIVGAIPLSFRRFLIRPGQAITTTFENAVGVKEELRGQGVGTKIIDAAAEFLADRCDALMVYRSAERSAAYRFYRKTGHEDLHYIQSYALAEPKRGKSLVTVGDLDRFLAAEEEVAPIFAGAYAGYAGFPTREPGYWKWAMSSHIWKSLPTEFAMLQLRYEGRLVGYALLGIRHTRWIDNRYHIYEMAVESNEHVLAEEILAGAEDYAAERGKGLSMTACRWHPYYPLLKDHGFEADSRCMITMGKPLNPSGMLHSMLAYKPGTSEMTLKIWTPERDFVVETGNGRRKLVLEMKDETLVRLIMGRVDLRSAIRLEQITAVGDDSAVEALAEALPFTPWVYHEIDYV